MILLRWLMANVERGEVLVFLHDSSTFFPANTPSIENHDTTWHLPHFHSPTWQRWDISPSSGISIPTDMTLGNALSDGNVVLDILCIYWIWVARYCCRCRYYQCSWRHSPFLEQLGTERPQAPFGEQKPGRNANDRVWVLCCSITRSSHSYS